MVQPVMRNPHVSSTGMRATHTSFATFKTWFAASLCLATTLLARAEVLQSPKGEEVFGSQAIIAAPPTRTVTLGWQYPASFVTPDLVFKVYRATDLHRPFREWALLTNIPGGHRSAIVPADQTKEFFIMTASNYLGESQFAGTR
jgi:hypothetical protein